MIHQKYYEENGPGSVGGIASGYRLDGPGIESRWGEIFLTCPDRPWGPPSLLLNGYRVFPEGKERPGRDADPSPPSSAVGNERVELYLYSPYGPYGLHRASVPVQGCTLQFLLWRENPESENTSRARWRNWLRHCATSRKVARSIPDGVIGFFSFT